MNQTLTEIVIDRSNLWESIDYKKLRNNTRRLPRSFFGSVAWEQIEHLHILGSNNAVQLMDVRGGLEPGAYINSEHNWLLIIGPTIKQIFNCVKACGAALELLDIRFTEIERIELNHLPYLSVLNLACNEKLLRLNGLGNLAGLTELNLYKTNLWGPLDIRNCVDLKILNVSASMTSHIVIDHVMTKLRHLCASSTRIADADFVVSMPNLRTLDLSETAIDQVPSMEFLPELRSLDLSWTDIEMIPGLASLKKLEELNLSYTRVMELEHIEMLSNLRSLSLASTPLQNLPEGIRELKYLRRLNLSNMALADLPSWLSELGIRFNSSTSNGIILSGTTIMGMDPSILSQSHELITQWMKMRSSTANSVPLNELKVVFLGDGESGKSYTISRLLNNGGQPVSYDDSVTPGIAIHNMKYNIGNRNIHVHYWDFGGQEILHSMHRIFMTRRTLYVVLINARDNTQDERARYWLHNIASFAEGSPVIMVLNKIDQNPNASINETELRYRYPNLTQVIKLSALNASRDEFNSVFTNQLLDVIARFDTPKSFFPQSWLQIKNHVQTMGSTYLDQNAFQSICERYGVYQPEIMNSLCDWFTDLGVSFCYRGDRHVREYVVLNPGWITNAIYIILFNKRDAGINGVIPHQAIHDLLSAHNPNTQCVLPNIRYSKEETQFVLNVIRQFQLSYEIRSGLEFMPMLCQRNAMPIAMDYAEDPLTLEYRMVYDYLPNNVIHYLMVERQYDLDKNNVWLTGARFSQERSSGLSAVVRIDGNILKINVRSTMPEARPSQYRDSLVSDIEAISSRLTLKIKERQIAYKNEGIAEFFDHDELNGYLECGIQNVYSKKLKKLIHINDILNQSNSKDSEDKNRLIRDIQNVLRTMQRTLTFQNCREESCNLYIRDSLGIMGYMVADQTNAGVSSSFMPLIGLDLEIRKEPRTPWTILESLVIRGISPAHVQNWNDHLEKLVTNYAPYRLRFQILLCYVECGRDRFMQIMRHFGNHLQHHAPTGFILDGSPQSQTDESNTNLYVFRCIYKTGGYSAEVYHFFLRIGS